MPFQRKNDIFVFQRNADKKKRVSRMLRPQNKLFVMAVMMVLAGCSSVKKELGVGRNSPDEFTVIKHAPLTLPPDYSLRPPANPNNTPPEAQAANMAKAALMGKEESAVASGSAESALLSKMGAGSAVPDIRQKIDEENGYIALKNRTVAEKLIFWNDESGNTEKMPASVVDPKGEAQRLLKNKTEGKPVTTGTVPVIEKKQNTLDKIF
jgi:hypothetical protein